MQSQTVIEEKNFSDSELLEILHDGYNPDFLQKQADFVRRAVYGNEVFIRGLIEFSNICENDCLYCGLRRSNKKAARYRLSEKEIMKCCDNGYNLGFRTFVLQSGENASYTDNEICSMIGLIKSTHPDCAITLSIGEKPYKTYKSYFQSGADRYLLRHETASSAHYKRLHPSSMSIENRKRCLFDLKEIGFQVGAGFMVGSPYQTNKTIVEDLRFLQALKPAMIGIGPFIAHSDTPFATFKNGSVEKTLLLISLLRLLFPFALIPATTALCALDKCGYERGLQAGANVVMPNISPLSARKKYTLYERKPYIDKCIDETEEHLANLEQRTLNAGYKIVVSRGDAKKISLSSRINTGI